MYDAKRHQVKFSEVAICQMSQKPTQVHSQAQKITANAHPLSDNGMRQKISKEKQARSEINETC